LSACPKAADASIHRDEGIALSDALTDPPPGTSHGVEDLRVPGAFSVFDKRSCASSRASFI